MNVLIIALGYPLQNILNVDALSKINLKFFKEKGILSLSVLIV